MRPARETYPDYYENYIPLVKENTIKEALLENEKTVLNFFRNIPSSKADFAYADGKWTIKGVLNHLIDTERIFSYRALRFARKDFQQPLPYDENHYAEHAELAERTLDDLIHEFETVRKATISLFNSFSNEALQQVGQTAAGKAGVNAIGYTIVGHAIHHMNVVKERYLK
jgi:uncharacterized damage-inducible protein DinB